MEDKIFYMIVDDRVPENYEFYYNSAPVDTMSKEAGIDCYNFVPSEKTLSDYANTIYGLCGDTANAKQILYNCFPITPGELLRDFWYEAKIKVNPITKKKYIVEAIKDELIYDLRLIFPINEISKCPELDYDEFKN